MSEERKSEEFVNEYIKLTPEQMECLKDVSSNCTEKGFEKTVFNLGAHGVVVFYPSEEERQNEIINIANKVSDSFIAGIKKGAIIV